jgi:NitT/TauT family transport system ATP-binding protein
MPGRPRSARTPPSDRGAILTAMDGARRRGAAVRFRDVDVTYAPTRRGQAPVPALAGVSLEIAAGEFVAVVGPSGCGKSTLLRLLAGLVAPTAGWLGIGGVAVDGPRADTAMVFQRPALLPWRDVRGNVRLPGEVGAGRQRVSAERVEALLRLVGLEGFGDRYPAELSGGMQSRVALARALVTTPSLLLLDEPFAALDLLLREELAAELERIWLGDPSPQPPPQMGMETGSRREREPGGGVRPTVLLVTHSIAEAVRLADRVVVMSPRPGRVVADVAVLSPRPRPADPDTAEAISAARAVREALASGRD